jgi:hypothetical protein
MRVDRAGGVVFTLILFFLFAVSAQDYRKSCSVDVDLLKRMVYVNTSVLNLRSSPDDSSRKLALLRRGYALERTENSIENSGSDWIEVLWRGPRRSLKGWVHKSYTVKSRAELMNRKFTRLDYSPQDKPCEYEGNPRVEVKGIYLTMYSAMEKRIGKFINIAKNSEINSLVIDVKNINGRLLFKNSAAEKHNPVANRRAIYKDFSPVMRKIKESGIYTIARIVVFKDDQYAKRNRDSAILNKVTGEPFRDRDKLRWVSPYDRGYWDYITDLSVEAVKLGFNEVQFDYVRFPEIRSGLELHNSRGELKAEAIQNFLKHAYSKISAEEGYVSADVFGLIGSAGGDLNLGQYWEALSNVVDYISPMMYPSHYANGYGGVKIPDANPYKTISVSVRDALHRNKNIHTPALIRPWIQDFTAFWVKGHIRYEKKEIVDQITALKDRGVREYLLWNPRNRYQNLPDDSSSF